MVMRSHITRALFLVIILQISEVHSQLIPCDKKVGLVAAAGILSALLVVAAIIIVIQFKRRQSKHKDSPNLCSQQVRPGACGTSLGPQEHLAMDNITEQYDIEDHYDYVQSEDWYQTQPIDSRAPDVEIGTYSLPKDSAVVCVEVTSDIYERVDSFETISDINEPEFIFQGW
ncbi:uncharacterized protein [Macrobrachium rosenbergii]|uniref:uncharacterized protein isoform X2 n=1 Tax=Macrobrachium rosenbergii TaxID=79674 RepID=UPI0034D3CBC0